jgi:hypothetical protein
MWIARPLGDIQFSRSSAWKLHNKALLFATNTHVNCDKRNDRDAIVSARWWSRRMDRVTRLALHTWSAVRSLGRAPWPSLFKRRRSLRLPADLVGSQVLQIRADYPSLQISMLPMMSECNVGLNSPRTRQSHPRGLTLSRRGLSPDSIWCNAKRII